MENSKSSPGEGDSGYLPAALAEQLGRAGLGTITPAMIEADLAAGAPCAADGSVNLLHYAAWLIRCTNGV